MSWPKRGPRKRQTVAASTLLRCLCRVRLRLFRIWDELRVGFFQVGLCRVSVGLVGKLLVDETKPSTSIIDYLGPSFIQTVMLS